VRRTKVSSRHRPTPPLPPHAREGRNRGNVVFSQLNRPLHIIDLIITANFYYVSPNVLMRLPFFYVMYCYYYHIKLSMFALRFLLCKCMHRVFRSMHLYLSFAAFMILTSTRRCWSRQPITALFDFKNSPSMSVLDLEAVALFSSGKTAKKSPSDYCT
jgi:hypothetical protein